MERWTLADVARHWNATLEYDAINDRTASYQRRFADSARLFSLTPGSHVLDVDARTGRGAAFFHARVPDLRFTCFVVSDVFGRMAQRRLAGVGAHATVQTFQSLPLPLADNSVDVALSYETVEHVPKPERFLAELVRVTKPGGTIVLTTPNVLWEPVHWLAPKFGLHHAEGPHRMVSRRRILRSYHQSGCRLLREKTTVLIPAGPAWLLAVGGWLEALLREPVMRVLGLRRIFVFEKCPSTPPGND